MFNYSGTLTDNGLSIGVQPTLGAGQSLLISIATLGEVSLVLVPEPGGILLASLGIVWIASRGRRRAILQPFRYGEGFGSRVHSTSLRRASEFWEQI